MAQVSAAVHSAIGSRQNEARVLQDYAACPNRPITFLFFFELLLLFLIRVHVRCDCACRCLFGVSGLVFIGWLIRAKYVLWGMARWEKEITIILAWVSRAEARSTYMLNLFVRSICRSIWNKFVGYICILGLLILHWPSVTLTIARSSILDSAIIAISLYNHDLFPNFASNTQHSNNRNIHISCGDFTAPWNGRQYWPLFNQHPFYPFKVFYLILKCGGLRSRRRKTTVHHTGCPWLVGGLG